MEPPRAARAVSPAGREPSRDRAAARPPGHGSLRITPPRRSAAIPVSSGSLITPWLKTSMPTHDCATI